MRSGRSMFLETVYTYSELPVDECFQKETCGRTYQEVMRRETRHSVTSCGTNLCFNVALMLIRDVGSKCFT